MKPVIFITILALYLGLSFYVYVRGLHALPTLRPVRITYSILFVFLTFGYMLTMMFRKYLPMWFSDIAELASSTWFIAFIYIVMAVIFIDLVRLANYFFHFFPPWITADIARTKLVVLYFVLGLLALLFTWGYMRFSNPAVNELTLELDKGTDKQKDVRLVVVSDLHMGSIIGKSTVKRFVEQINAQKPDVVLMVGDMFNADFRSVEVRKLNEELRQLNAPLGVYAVLGNHEYILDSMSEKLAYLEGAGIRVLRDSIVAIADSSLYIVGRDDRANRHRKTLSELVLSLDNQRAIVLMDHQPFHLEEAEQNGVDLMLCGHTHNGQVFPISLIVKRMYELTHGYMQKGSSHIYVSAGLGLWGPPFRIGTDSEIVVINLKIR